MARRIQRKDLKHDDFVDAAVDATHWLERNWQKAAIGVAAAVVAVAAIVGWVSWSGHNRDVAREILARGVTSFRQAEERNFDPTLLAESMKSFDEAVDRGGSAAVTKVARFYKGAALAHLDRRDEAISELESLTADDLPPTLEPIARQMLARLYAEADRTDEAAALLERLAGTDEPLVPVPHTLMQLAEVRAQAGDTDGARAAWQRVVDEFADTPSASLARERLDN